LKEFGLNLKGKDCFKKSLKKRKRKEENLPSYLLSLAAQRPIYPLPQRPVTLLSFLFFPRTLTTGPRLSASPRSLSFLLLLPAAQPTRRRRDPRRAPPLPFLPSSPSRPIKAINSPVINWSRYPSLST
jgi:hypothetical protein